MSFRASISRGSNGIKQFGRGEDVGPEARRLLVLKGPADNEVNLASQEVAQLDEQAARLSARRVALIEAHQQIQIAIRVRRAFIYRASRTAPAWRRGSGGRGRLSARDLCLVRVGFISPNMIRPDRNRQYEADSCAVPRLSAPSLSPLNPLNRRSGRTLRSTKSERDVMAPPIAFNSDACAVPTVVKRVWHFAE